MTTTESGPVEAAPATPAPAAPQEAPGANQPAPAPGAQVEVNSQNSGTKPDANGRAFNEAYAYGRQFASDASLSAIIRSLTAATAHFGNTYHYYGYERYRDAISSGSIGEAELSEVRERYVPVLGYEAMARKLAELKLIILYGLPGSGRFTTALRLLDEPTRGCVHQIIIDADIKSIVTSRLDSGRGYVGRLSNTVADALTEANLGALRDAVATANCYCVLIVDDEPRLRLTCGRYLVDCAPPDQTELVNRLLAGEVREDDPPGMEDRIVELAGEEWFAKALGPAPRPGEIARMAKQLARHGRGEISQEDVVQEGAQLVKNQVLEWFARLSNPASDEALREELRITAFRIALAVFDQSPYHDVMAAAARLAEQFNDLFVADDDGKPATSRFVFVDDETQRLPQARAHTVDGWVSSGGVRVPIKLVKYMDDRLPLVLLTYVWQRHHNLRAAMNTWLLKLAWNSRATVWVRVAQVIGMFGTLDYDLTFADLISPFLSTSGEVAAVALDQIARDEKLRPAVFERLGRWRRGGLPDEQWIAATTLGYDCGRQNIAKTLEELRVLGTPSELPSTTGRDNDSFLVRAVAFSLARLFTFGEIAAVLDKLIEWTTSERQSLRELVWQTTLQLTGMRGYHLNVLDRTHNIHELPVSRDRERWPLLIMLQHENPQYTKGIADLVHWALQGRRSDQMGQLLRTWMRAGEKDEDCLYALLDFVPLLVRNPFDAKRLNHLIDRLCRDWADPLGGEVARRLLNAVHEPDIVEVAP